MVVTSSKFSALFDWNMVPNEHLVHDSGKTHTMVGTQQEPGLIPQCAAELFKVIDAQQQLAPEWKFKVLFSYLEIYQEKVL